CPVVDRVIAVTDDAAAARVLAGLGALVTRDEPGRGLNPALRHGAALAAARWPGSGIGALAADLPALRPAELGIGLREAARRGPAYRSGGRSAGLSGGGPARPCWLAALLAQVWTSTQTRPQGRSRTLVITTVARRDPESLSWRCRLPTSPARPRRLMSAAPMSSARSRAGSRRWSHGAESMTCSVRANGVRNGASADRN